MYLGSISTTCTIIIIIIIRMWRPDQTTAATDESETHTRTGLLLFDWRTGGVSRWIEMKRLCWSRPPDREIVYQDFRSCFCSASCCYWRCVIGVPLPRALAKVTPSVSQWWLGLGWSVSGWYWAFKSDSLKSVPWKRIIRWMTTFPFNAEMNLWQEVGNKATELVYVYVFTSA